MIFASAPAQRTGLTRINVGACATLQTKKEDIDVMRGLSMLIGAIGTRELVCCACVLPRQKKREPASIMPLVGYH